MCRQRKTENYIILLETRNYFYRLPLIKTKLSKLNLRSNKDYRLSELQAICGPLSDTSNRYDQAAKDRFVALYAKGELTEIF